jgi:membrane dipeptidase
MTGTTVGAPREALIWDQHACLPLRPDASIEGLSAYVDAGIGFVSVNVGFDAMRWEEDLHVLANFRRRVLGNPERFVLVDTIDDVLVARETGRLAVSFDLEGANALDGDVAMVEVFHRLGVRAMLIAYNHANRAGGGCHDDPNQGLTKFGREVVREMNRVGMLVDATHCSRQTTIDLFEFSDAPVIFSHSVPNGVAKHDRNIDDEQMRACAATGGVIGIAGVGLFLGDPTASTEALFRAVDYAVGVVGPRHIGLGLDYVVDQAELDAWMEENPGVFPPGSGYGAGMAIARPAQIPELAELLRDAGYEERDVRAILGENFLRVAGAVWSSRSAVQASGRTI